MLTDQDVLLLKLALERELLNSASYRQVLDTVRRAGTAGGVGRALRQVGVAGERVSELAEICAAASKDPNGQILARIDLEDALVARAIERSKAVPEDKLERARNELRGLARTGELTSLSEVLVRRRWLEVPVAVEFRRRARERVATCSSCKRHYVIEPDKAKDGRYKCRECNVVLAPGTGAHSAVEVARGILPERAPPPIEASQLVQMSPEQMEQLRQARERGMQKERERLVAAKVGSERSPEQGRRAPSGVGPALSPSGLGTVPGGATGTATPPPGKTTPVPPGRATPQPPTAAPPASGTVRRGTGPLGGPVPAPAAPAAPPGERDRLVRAEKDTSVLSGAAMQAIVNESRPEAPGRAPATPAAREGGGGRSPDEESAPAAARWDSVHDDSAEKSPAPSPVVATFGEYEILSEVARGGMGIVYKARRKGAQKLLALKVLISGVDATPEQVMRFEAEGENARKLRHPGIVRIYDAGRHEGYHYIAMEFVEGQTLEEILTKGPLEPRRAARIIHDVALAVDVMHDAKIVHRDLKPGNVILNETDAPKLIDFGLAKAIDRRGKLTRSGAAVGTPYYMPPEQVRGEAEKIGPWSDVYALGAILFEMLVGDVPFRAENPIELYHKIASTELTLPSALREGLPDELTTIVAKAMEKAPEDRYPSADEFAADLARFLNGQPIEARRKGSVAHAVERAHRHRAIVVALAAIAVLVGALVVAVAKLKQKPDDGVRALQDKGRAELLGKRPQKARSFFEMAITMASSDPSLEVDLARALAAAEPADVNGALDALERAEKKGLSDAEALEAFELRRLADEPRFQAVRSRLKGKR